MSKETRSQTDYRFVPNERGYGDLASKKQAIINKMRPDCINHYGALSKNSAPHKKDFISAFRCRCCYCGKHEIIIGSENFQIDHRIPISSEEDENKALLNNIDNLVLACPDCNRTKGQRIVTKDNADKFDVEKLGLVFVRSPRTFKLSIADEFEADQDYQDFYRVLNLGSDRKRIDYLVYYCQYHLDKELISDNKKRECIQKVVRVLREKRNATTSD